MIEKKYLVKGRKQMRPIFNNINEMGLMGSYVQWFLGTNLLTNKLVEVFHKQLVRKGRAWVNWAGYRGFSSSLPKGLKHDYYKDYYVCGMYDIKTGGTYVRDPSRPFGYRVYVSKYEYDGYDKIGFYSMLNEQGYNEDLSGEIQGKLQWEDVKSAWIRSKNHGVVLLSNTIYYKLFLHTKFARSLKVSGCYYYTDIDASIYCPFQPKREAVRYGYNDLEPGKKYGDIKYYKTVSKYATSYNGTYRDSNGKVKKYEYENRRTTILSLQHFDENGVFIDFRKKLRYPDAKVHNDFDKWMDEFLRLNPFIRFEDGVTYNLKTYTYTTGSGDDKETHSYQALESNSFKNNLYAVYKHYNTGLLGHYQGFYIDGYDLTYASGLQNLQKVTVYQNVIKFVGPILMYIWKEKEEYEYTVKNEENGTTETKKGTRILTMCNYLQLYRNDSHTPYGRKDLFLCMWSELFYEFDVKRKEKWYEHPLFKLFVLVVSAVLIYLSWGTASPWVSSILFALGMFGFTWYINVFLPEYKTAWAIFSVIVTLGQDYESWANLLTSEGGNIAAAEAGKQVALQMTQQGAMKLAEQSALNLILNYVQARFFNLLLTFGNLGYELWKDNKFRQEQNKINAEREARLRFEQEQEEKESVYFDMGLSEDEEEEYEIGFSPDDLVTPFGYFNHGWYSHYYNVNKFDPQELETKLI